MKHGADEHGSVSIEYAVVLLLVSLIVAIAAAALGLPLFQLFVFSESIIGLPIP